MFFHFTLAIPQWSPNGPWAWPLRGPPLCSHTREVQHKCPALLHGGIFPSASRVPSATRARHNARGQHDQAVVARIHNTGARTRHGGLASDDDRTVQGRAGPPHCSGGCPSAVTGTPCACCLALNREKNGGNMPSINQPRLSYIPGHPRGLTALSTNAQIALQGLLSTIGVPLVQQTLLEEYSLPTAEGARTAPRTT